MSWFATRPSKVDSMNQADKSGRRVIQRPSESYPRFFLSCVPRTRVILCKLSATKWTKILLAQRAWSGENKWQTGLSGLRYAVRRQQLVVPSLRSAGRPQARNRIGL